MIPIASRPVALAAAGVYFVVTLGIGLWAWRRTRSAADFFVAGRRLPLVVMAFAAMASSFSGFVFIGGPGLTYRIGVAAFFINLPVSFTAALMCWVVGKRLRLLAEVRELFTIPDALAARFPASPVAGLSALAVLLGTVAYLGSQVLALGRLLESMLATNEWAGSWGLLAAMLIGLGVVLIYSVSGGMLAGVYTDFLQGLLMMGAAGAVFFYALEATGGAAAALGSIAGSETFGSRFLHPFEVVPLFTALGFFFVFGLGTLGQPHVLHKFYMIRDPRQLKWAPALLAGSQSLCLLIWLGIGLAVPGLVAQGKLAALTEPDQAAALFLLNFTPGLLTGLVLAGVLAAIMSTADAFLNIGAAALVRDIPRALGRRLADEFYWGRVATIGIALSALGFAYWYGDLVALLGTFAFGTFAAALAPALAVGLNWKRVSAQAAAASIATGLILNWGLELLSRWAPQASFLAAGVLPSAIALAASFAVLLIFSFLTDSGKIPEDVERVMEL